MLKFSYKLLQIKITICFVIDRLYKIISRIGSNNHLGHRVVTSVIPSECYYYDTIWYQDIVA